MALFLMLEVLDEQEAIDQFQNDPRVVGVYKRPTLFCERTADCRLGSQGFVNTRSSRNQVICRFCGRFVRPLIYKTTTNETFQKDSLNFHWYYGQNLIEKFRKMKDASERI